ncbi:MAG: UDP-forming cellulose synthase catalytic subunit, partial [Pseudomonadota bacterium]
MKNPASLRSLPSRLVDLLGAQPFRGIAWVLTLGIVAVLIITPMTLQQQLILSIGILVAAILVNRTKGKLGTLVLIFLSVIVSSRYMYWRITETMFMD